jgi:hypothetical protein
MRLVRPGPVKKAIQSTCANRRIRRTPPAADVGSITGQNRDNVLTEAILLFKSRQAVA